MSATPWGSEQELWAGYCLRGWGNIDRSALSMSSLGFGPLGRRDWGWDLQGVVWDWSSAFEGMGFPTETSAHKPPY